MNAQPQAQKETKGETKDSTDFKNKLAKFINPFYVSFVIFWVVCNYDFLLILIGKKAILHELYAHFGYGCSVVVKGVNGTPVTKYFACTDPWLPWNLHLPYALRFILHFFYWKVAIPLFLTWFHTHFVYPTIITNVNNKHRANIRDEKKQIYDDEKEEMYQYELDRQISLDAEQMFSGIKHHTPPHEYE